MMNTDININDNVNKVIWQYYLLTKMVSIVTEC